MYAGGHPPLPSFEFVAFSSQMPAHWRTLRAKGAFAGRDNLPPDFGRDKALRASLGLKDDDLKSSYREANFPGAAHDPFQDLEATQGVAISGLVVMRDYLKLLQTGFAESGTTRSPEFALFDCTACHHELRSATVRRPGHPGVPGRPPLQFWPTTLARAGLWQVTGDDKQSEMLLTEFDRRWQTVQRAATQRPFGDAQGVHAAAGEFVTWLQPRIADISRQPFDERSALRAWQFLCNPAQNPTHDYHAARQTAWALTALANDVGRGNTIDALLFPNGEDRLKLRLPAGQSGKVLDDLQRSLSAIANYDAEWFESALGKLKPNE
jgi:hypothetical protein